MVPDIHPQVDDTHYKLLDSEVAMALATGIADKDRNVFQHALTCVTFLALGVLVTLSKYRQIPILTGRQIHGTRY